MTRKIKKIIAQALLLTMVLPNISVRATENISVNESNEIVETVDKPVNDNIIDNVDTSSKEEDTEAGETNETVEETQDNSDKVSDEVEEVEVDSETENVLSDNIEPEITNDLEEENNSTEEESLVGSKYEEVGLNSDVRAYSLDEEFEREEFRLTTEAMQEYTVLKTKTDEDYEVAFAYSDGSYRFVDGASSYDEAMAILESTPSPRSEESSVPVIISRTGQVVYSTNSIGRVIKYINGAIDPTYNNNSNIYSNSQMSSAFTYINHGFVKDVPVLEVGAKSAKVMVNGYTGWMNKDAASGNFDLEIIPVTHVSNPSYYISEGGVLYHYISTDPTAAFNTRGHKNAIGSAPSYMKNGAVYLSYDGKYFYDGSNISNGLNTLINDLKGGHNNNSINGSNPHYNYYQYIPFRSKTIYSAEALNSFINSNTSSNSKLRGIGQALKNAEKSYGVNALIALGISINESGWGMSSISQSKNNIFGLNAVDTNPGLAANEFPNVTACINDFTKNWISSGYSDPADWRYYGGFVGNKAFGLNVKYASDPFWGEKASKYAFQLDLQLSGNINSLQDTNAYQLGVFTSTNEVRNRDNTLLYKVNNNFNEYSSYVGGTFILTNKDVVNINGRASYEIYAERNTPVNKGGSANKYHGNYNWADKGYINASGVKFVNTKRDVKPPMEVLGGSTRYETAVELSKSKFESAETVIIVNDDAIIDGVTSSALATALNAPILLARQSRIEQSIKDEIKRLGAKKVILIGGEAVLGQGVVNDLNALGIGNITRLGGSTRYETALNVAKYIDQNLYDVSEVFIVNGYGEADALSAGAISGQNRIPILLTESKAINSAVKTWLSGEGLTNGYVIGGTTVISDNIINELNAITSNNVSGNRLGGRDRYDTNAYIIDRFYGDKLNSVYVTKGLELIDPLAAGPIAAIDGSPIVIVDRDGLSQSQIDVLSVRSTNRIVQAGLGVPQAAINTLINILNIYGL